jgi:hypothetical protein
MLEGTAAQNKSLDHEMETRVEKITRVVYLHGGYHGHISNSHSPHLHCQGQATYISRLLY